MPLLLEVAITPDVFDLSSYGNEELADSRFDLLRELVFNDAIVRNIKDGAWSLSIINSNRQLYRRGAELLKKLSTQGRLQNFGSISPSMPISDIEWCKEALVTHKQKRLDGIISTKLIASQLENNEIVTAMHKLSRSHLWASREQSVRPSRNLESYLLHLSHVFSSANSLIFIDPYLDPSEANYKDLPRLISAAMQKKPMPHIEIHRKITDGKRNIVANPEWEKRFNCELLPALPVGAKIEVFLWDEMHNRYLISNVIGISMAHGFDTSLREKAITTWSRLSKEHSDDIRAEFDANSVLHKCQHKFILRK